MSPNGTRAYRRAHTHAHARTQTYIPSLTFWCWDVWTSRKSYPFFSPPIFLLFRYNLSASELNFIEKKIIWNWKCTIIKSSIKSNGKFNESRKMGLSETHQSERLGEAPVVWMNEKLHHCIHICHVYRTSSPLSISLCLFGYCTASGAEWCTTSLLLATCAHTQLNTQPWEHIRYMQHVSQSLFNMLLHHIFMRYAHTRSHTQCDFKTAEEVKNPFLIKHRSHEILIVNKFHCIVLLSGQHSSVVVSTVASQQECNGFKSKLGPFCGDG